MQNPQNTTLLSHFPVSTHKVTTGQLQAYFDNAWELYTWLFSSIKDEKSYYLAPDSLRHPLIFYWGHTAAFYVNKLVMNGLLKKGIHPTYEELFAKGVDPNQADELDTRQAWPSLKAVNNYRAEVYQAVSQVIQNYPLNNLPITPEHPLWALLMGIEHDRIHFETSSVLIRQMPEQLLQRPKGWEYAATNGHTPDNQLIQVPATTLTLGKPSIQNSQRPQDQIFGWDHEFGQLKVEVAEFQAMKNLVTNEEYLDFVESGAYNEEQYWTKAGWNWKQSIHSQHPKFWTLHGSEFLYRAMFDSLPMPYDWPIEVNAYEAQAYCKWKGAEWRLLREAEFHAIMQTELKHEDSAFSNRYNLHLAYGSPSPVGALPASRLGFHDLMGNVWDWLSDHFYAFPGFEKHRLYEDWSSIYYDDEHDMLLGGSWATHGNSSSKYYRQWFRPHFYQHAGFRLVKG